MKSRGTGMTAVEAYLEPCQTSKVERFEKKINC